MHIQSWLNQLAGVGCGIYVGPRRKIFNHVSAYQSTKKTKHFQLIFSVVTL